MSLAGFDEVVSFDEEGRIDGFQFNNRARRIQEWRERKEQDDFDKMVAKLRQSKRWRKWYLAHRDDPGFREKMREHNRRMRLKHGAKRNAEARQKRQEANPLTVNVCQECHKEFAIEFGFKRKRTSKFCSRSCRNRSNHKLRKVVPEFWNAEVLELVRSRYSISAKEAAVALNVSTTTVRRVLNKLAYDGTINKWSDKIPFRFSIW